MQGWVKIHRKILDNNIWLRDITAWHIFEYFLLVANQNGQLSYGRKRLAEILEIHESTIYRAIKRLEKAKMVTQKPNNKFTNIYICNWEKYQSSANRVGNNKVTTSEQQSNNKVTHYKNIRNKEYKNIRIEKRELITPTQKEELIFFLTEKGLDKQLVVSELEKFISYWSEKNISGTKQRWQMQKTWETKRRLATWFNNINKFTGVKNEKRGYRL